MTNFPREDNNQPSFPSKWTIPGLLVLLLGLLGLPWIPLPSDTHLWKAINNFGHAPLYGSVAIVLLYLSRQLGWSSGSQYVVAFIGVVMLGWVSEGIQSGISGRQSEWTDFLRDVVGAVCALGLFLIYDHNSPRSLAAWRQAPRKHLIYVGVGILMIFVLSPVLSWSYAYWERTARFPSLCQFSSPWEMMFVKETDSELHLVPPPTGWEKSRRDTVGRVVFYAKSYPGIRIDEPYPDWRGYSVFRFDVYSELSTPRSLAIRIDDAHHNHEYEDRFNTTIKILPGLNHIQISLNEIRTAPVGREMNLGAIATVLLFAVSPSEQFSLYVDNIRLE